MNAIQKRQLAKLDYIDPEELLRGIMPVMVQLLQQPETMKHLSGKQRKEFFEKHQAGFLAFMMKHITGSQADVKVCFTENEDYDCVIRAAMVGHETAYKHVQLKQLSSHPADKKPNLQAIIDDLKNTYRGSPDLVVGIWINRDSDLDLSQLNFEGLNIEQLWFFGDSLSGETTLDGGHISQLLVGFYLSGIMRGGVAQIPRLVRFRPCHSAKNK